MNQEFYQKLSVVQAAIDSEKERIEPMMSFSNARDDVVSAHRIASVLARIEQSLKSIKQEKINAV